MRSLRRHRGFIELFTALWLPFCCCQWRGAVAALDSDAGRAEVGCCGSCCSNHSEPESTTPAPADPNKQCSADCCIRGEVPPPSWEPPADRVQTFPRAETSADDGSIALARPHCSRHGPPLGESPPGASPIDSNTRIQI